MIETYYNVWCDGIEKKGCFFWCSEGEHAALTKREAVRNAKRFGWVERVRDGKRIHLCSACATGEEQ